MAIFDIERLLDELHHDLTHDPDILNSIAHAARHRATPAVMPQIATMVFSYAEVGDATALDMAFRGLGTFIGTGLYISQEHLGRFIEPSPIE